jgi:hypothetical protein
LFVICGYIPIVGNIGTLIVYPLVSLRVPSLTTD